MATNLLQKNLRLFIEANELAGANGSAVSSVSDLSGWNSTMAASSNYPVIGSSTNGKKAIVWDGTKNPLQTANEPMTINSGFLVVNIDEFTNYNGVLTTLENYGILLGKNNLPEWFDVPEIEYFELRLNDRIYPRDAATAPVGQWGIVFFRTWVSFIADGIQLGRERLDNTKKLDGKIALLALYNREWCEEDIRKNTESIASSYQIAINNVFPYQGSKTDTGEIGRPHLTDGQLEPVIRIKSDRTWATYDLDFQNRRLSEYKTAKIFYLGYYPDERFIFRNYNEIPPVDLIGRGTTPFQDRGNVGALKNYGFGFTESDTLSAPQIPIAPVIPEEINDVPYIDTAPTITTTTLPNAINGVAYNQTITKTGGNAPFVWSVSSGSLPPGITLNSSTGVLSGTSTTEGAYSFTILVTDNDTDSDPQAFTMSVVAMPSLNILFDGDSTIANVDIPSWATNNIAAKVQAVLGAGYVCTNVGVAGGSLNLGAGNLHLTNSAPTRVDALYDEDAVDNILFIKSFYNDITGGRTLAQYRSDLEAYIAARVAVGWKVVIVAPGNSDYPGQAAKMHKWRLDWLVILNTDWAAMGAEAIVNYSGSNLIGTESDTYSARWLDKLHPAADYNTEAAPYYAQTVKVLDGTATAPTKPVFAAKALTSTSIQISRNNAPDGYAVTSYQYRIDGGTAIALTTNPLTVSSLTAGTAYTVEVRAVGSGTSGWADVKSVTTKGTGAWDMSDLGDVAKLDEFYEDVAMSNPATSDGNDVLAVGDSVGSDHFTDTTVGATHGATLQLAEIGTADALQFVGNVSDYSKLVHDTLGDDLTNGWMLGFGYKAPFAITDSGVIFMWGDLTTGERRSAVVDPFAPGILEFSGYGSNLSTEVGVADNAPHWILMVRDGTLVTIYVDGVKIVSGRPVLSAYSSSGAAWGGNYQDLTELFYGFTTGVYVKKSAPTALQIHRANDFGMSLLGI